RPAKASEEESCAQTILSALSRRAYRRAPSDADVETLMTFYRAGRKTGTFDTGIQRALERLLAGPDFVFRIERDPEGTSKGSGYKVARVELGSGLLFFPGSRLPGHELLTAALKGTLSDPAVLEQQVRRMLADSRSRAVVDNFAAQWLELGKLRGFSADPDA